MKTHDVLVRVGKGRHSRSMLTTEILTAGTQDDYLGLVDYAERQMCRRNIPVCTVYQWDGSEYIVSEWIERV